MSTPWSTMRCEPMHGEAWDRAAVDEALRDLPEWRYDAEANALLRDFTFANYHETIAFVNALAWVVHREDHHPDLHVSYARCVVAFSTHSVGGVSRNDFICAAKTDAVYAQGRA